MTIKPQEQSEFGKGYAYCLGLFLAHADRVEKYKEYEAKVDSGGDIWPGMWFNAAADHLFELQIPASLSEESKTAIQEFQTMCIKNRHESPKWEDVINAIQFAKNLLLEWDKFNGIECTKGSYE